MLRKVRKSRLWGASLLSIICYLILSTPGALAHAVVIRAEPPDGAVLAASPGTMTLWLNEAVVPRFSSVQLLNAENRSTPEVSVAVDPQDHTVLQIALPPLPPGGYTLFWKVLSDVDGHFSQGFVTLTIGEAAAVARPTSAALAGVATPLEGLLRWSNYLLLTGLIGALAMLYLVLPAAAAQGNADATAAQQRLRRTVWRWAATCATAAFLVGLALLAWQVATAQALMVDAPTWSAQLLLILGGGQWGLLWLVRQGLLLFLSGALWYWARLPQEPTAAWPWLLLYGRVFDLTIVQALTGHSGGNQHDWLLTLSNAAVHLLAAGVWVGGLMSLGLIFWTRRRQTQPVDQAWRPIEWRAFSLAAVVSVTLLFATGFYSTGQQVASLDALITTIYGQVLLGKVVLVLLAGCFGLANALLVHPAFATWVGRRFGRPAGWRPWGGTRLSRLMGIEVACGLLILGAAGVLTASVPPRGVEYTIGPDEIKPVLGQRVDDLIVTLEAKPNRLGQNLFNVRTVSTETSPPTIARVSLNFTYGGAMHAPVTAIGEEVETNLYQVTGNYLNQAGPWQIDVTVQRYEVADSIAHFRWIAPPAGELQPVILSKAPWTGVLTGLAAGLVGLLAVVVAIVVMNRERFRQPAVGQPVVPGVQAQPKLK